jgi:8-oxo-dGTP pyrophosphatase MutT (NUDIX family)
MPRRPHQVAALPWRQGENGLEILLVTTRTTKRWVIPKGWTMKGKADHEAAATEAYEEAGVQGDVQPAPVGSYGYLKLMRNGEAKHITVQVYAMRVQDVLDDWPEREERERKWVDLAQALAMIGEPELLPVVEAFKAIAPLDGKVSSGYKSLLDLFRKWWRKLLA